MFPHRKVRVKSVRVKSGPRLKGWLWALHPAALGGGPGFFALTRLFVASHGVFLIVWVVTTDRIMAAQLRVQEILSPMQTIDAGRCFYVFMLIYGTVLLSPSIGRREDANWIDRLFGTRFASVNPPIKNSDKDHDAQSD